MSEQIQNISNEILEYKDKIFFKIFSDFLKEKKAPFPENVAHYLNLIFPTPLIQPSAVVLSSIKKENNNYIVSLTGPFDSYIEINGTATNFNSEGEIVDFNVPALIKADDILNFYISVVNFPYKKEKPADYTNDKTAQNMIDTIEVSNLLNTFEKIDEPVVGVLKYLNSVEARYDVIPHWISKLDAQNTTGKGFINFTNGSNVPIKIVFNNQEHILLEDNSIDVPFDLDEFLEVYKNPEYNQVHINNSEGTNVSNVQIMDLLTQDELNNVRININAALDRTSDKEFPAKMKVSLVNPKFFGDSGYYVNFLGSVIKVPSQAEGTAGISVSKAEVLAMDEKKNSVFVCDKDGNAIGKQIAPTAFVINNLKIIKTLIK